MSAVQRVAIVGGGAAGALAAIHLLREPQPRSPLEIELIDRTGEFGAGVAYGTRDPLHLLNVPAARMGAIAGRPEHFHRWLAGRGEAVAEEAFMPRDLYATYLRDLLASAERGAQGDQLRRRRGEVISVVEREEGVAIALAAGDELTVDRVVLALGPLQAGDPVEIPAALRDCSRYVGDPWAAGALESLAERERILIVGTGLTMVDVAISLAGRPGGPTVRAVSRHGLLPRRHRRDLTRVRPFALPIGDGGLDAIVGAVMVQICHATQRGEDWRDVIDSMRSTTPKIWKSLPLDEKRRFLTELHRLWDVHRFRIAPDVADRFERLESEGRVSCGAGSIISLESDRDGVQALLRTPGSEEGERIRVDAVVNCAGAGCDLLRQAPPLLAGLLAADRVRPDELGFGLDIDEDGAVLNAAGAPSQRIFAIGELRKGVEWEAIGITEIRDHSLAVARRITAEGESRQPAVAAPPAVARTPAGAALPGGAAAPTTWKAA
jgi:uncharacterized NAD(P)/FAD-binding protein YdhS